SPDWEVLLDLDELAAVEDEDWVWGFGGAEVLAEGSRALIRLSRGGADPIVVREFDLVAKAFVPDGFELLEEAKSLVAWGEDVDTVLVATDFGPGTLTAAGSPRVVKR